jgi:chaperone required for assembly of F1-ATPase
MKRFWKEVAIVDRAIRLDDRPIKTPGRAPLALPTDALATAVAEEWRAVKEGAEIDPRAMPFTGLANAAIDIVTPAPAPFAASLARYGESDLLCYRAAMPEPLVERQAAIWDPLLDWARGRYDIHFELIAGVMHRPQPPATIARLGEAVHARGPFALAALAPIVTIGGSLVAALALAEGAVDVDTVWRASQLDEDWQAEMWGDDPLAAGARDERHRDLHAAARFLAMVG